MMKQLSSKEYFLFTEAWLLLAFARAMLILLPFKRIAPLLGRVNEEVPTDDSDGNKAVLKNIQVAILRGSRYSPWRTKCFEQAIAGKVMLKKRGIKGTLYLGVFKDQANKLRAHSWLKAGDMVVTGGPVIEQYTVMSKFGS